MSGEKDLDQLLSVLSPTLAEGVYVFATVPNDVSVGELHYRMRFEEAEGTTLILEKTEAEAHDLKWQFPCRMITLDVHSSLEAVGFIARIATQLAAQGIAVNPVSGFYHDHLFVLENQCEEAMEVLKSRL